MRYESYEGKEYPAVRVVGAPGYEDFEARTLGIMFYDNGDEKAVVMSYENKIIVVNNKYVWELI